MLYTLNLYSAVCQLYLNKTGKKKIQNNRMEWFRAHVQTSPHAQIT